MSEQYESKAEYLLRNRIATIVTVLTFALAIYAAFLNESTSPEEIFENLCDELPELCENINGEVKLRQDGSDIKIRPIDPFRASFKKGSYDLDDSIQLQQMANFAALFVSRYHSASKYTNLSATFQGSSDGLGAENIVGIFRPIDDRPVTFARSDEYGDTLSQLRIEPGDKINNSDLAYLRAGELYKHFSVKLRELEVISGIHPVFFKGETHTEEDPSLRSGTITIHIFDPVNK